MRIFLRLPFLPDGLNLHVRDAEGVKVDGTWRRRLGLALALVGWLHLIAFGACWWLTVGVGYHGAGGYLAIWCAELLGALGILRVCAGSWPGDEQGRLVARVWLSYLLLAANLCTMNGLRGHQMFELFPAMASLASFGFLMMTFAVDGRFFAAVLVMFVSGLLMAAWHLHAYLIFAVAWWTVLNGIALAIQPRSVRREVPGRETAVAAS